MPLGSWLFPAPRLVSPNEPERGAGVHTNALEDRNANCPHGPFSSLGVLVGAAALSAGTVGGVLPSLGANASATPRSFAPVLRMINVPKCSGVLGNSKSYSLYLLSDPHTRWPAVIPVVAPVLLAGYACAVMQPSPRRVFSTPVAGLTVWMLALVKLALPPSPVLVEMLTVKPDAPLPEPPLPEPPLPPPPPSSPVPPLSPNPVVLLGVPHEQSAVTAASRSPNAAGLKWVRRVIWHLHALR